MNVGFCTIDASSARNLGVLFDLHMNFEGHFNVCRSLRFHPRNIGAIRKFLTDDAAAHIVHVLFPPG